MKNERFWNLAGMTKVFALLVSAIVVAFASVSCGSDVETEYKDKVYASAVTFDSTASDGTVTVTMKSATEGAEIYYTTDGTTTPNTESTKYIEPVSFTADTSIMAIAVKKGILNSPVSYAKVSIAEKKIIEQKEVEKTVEKEVDKKADETAPADVTNLAAVSKDSRVLLTWTDAADSDIYGYEVTYAKKDGSRVVLPALDSNAIMVANGLGGCYVNNLTNETEYTFTVKTVDTSGNKSEGQSVSAKPQAQDASQALAINLTSDIEHHVKRNDGTTKVTVNISLTTPSTVKKVVYKKDGSINAKKLLEDTSAKEATKGLDDKSWSFEIIAINEKSNGTYTIAAIDEAGREEAEQISITQIDFTAPPLVTGLTAECPDFGTTVTVSWTASDPDIDHVEISYTYNDGTSDSAESEKVVVSSGVTSKDFTVKQGPEASAKTYKYYVYSVDVAGNKSCIIDRNDIATSSANTINVAVVSGVTAGYKFHDTVEPAPATDKDSAGTSGTYVYFGDFPQTVKADKVIIDKTTTKTMGGMTYYKGSDDFWYAECYENAYAQYMNYTNNKSVKVKSENSIQYFKVEPIKWRVLSESYDHDLNSDTSGKKILLAENILNSGKKYDIDGANNSTKGKANDWNSSYIRQYLNGVAFSEDVKVYDKNIENKGFLQSAFSASAQNLIATTTVDNSNNTYKNKGWYEGTANTDDKIFLLSEMDLYNTNFGFINTTSDNPARDGINYLTDYAKANHNHYDGRWFSRTPANYHDDEYNEVKDRYIIYVGQSGRVRTSASGPAHVKDDFIGIRPALCLE